MPVRNWNEEPVFNDEREPSMHVNFADDQSFKSLLVATVKKKRDKMALASSSFYSTKSDERKIFEYERSPFTSVSLPTLSYKPTGRIITLAKPKKRQETTIRDGFSRYVSDPTYSGVSKAAAKASCSSRVTELATPLKRHNAYKLELPVPRPIPTTALKYQASTRVTELAEPKKLPGVR